MNIIVETMLLGAGCASLAAYILIKLIFKTSVRSYFDYLCVFFLLSWIIFRTVVSQHAPFEGIYESMIFFAFLYLVKAVFLSRFPGRSSAGWVTAMIMMPAFLMAFSALMLPMEMKITGPGEPALESFWIWLHVPCIFIGYVSLSAGLVLAILGHAGIKKAEDYLETEMKLAFYFTALGIITGGFWAQLSWGSFWSWDPKETWALFTLALLTLERHVNFDGRPFLRRAVIYAAALTMLLNYFGVTLLLPGLHSYFR
jgi:ABC-type transport system involved in cytochrome c biogenesis permease subunit